MIRRAAPLVLAALLPALAHAADDARRLATQYSSWAGGRSNADALVTGMQNGATVILTTAGPGNTRSLAGFTPQSRMSTEEVAAALARARANLAALGVRHPSADQIQAALIGGEVTLADGRRRALLGAIAPVQEPVAAR